MAVGPCKASFKNSRLFPRSAVTASVTGQVSALIIGGGATPNGNTILLPANPNRVGVTLYNEAVVDGGLDIFYSYVDAVVMGATGFKLKAGASIDLVDQGVIYVAGIGGASTVYFDEGSG